MKTALYYFDAQKREMAEWSEGSPLGHVVALRSKIGVAFAFNESGYVVGFFTDAGEYQALPSGPSRRHISDFGTKVKIESKPQMLSDLPEPGTLASLQVPLFNDDKYLFTASVRLLETISGRTVSIGRKWRIVFDMPAWRRAAAKGEDLFVGGAGPAGLKVEDKVIIRSKDLPSMIFAFSKFEGKEQS